MVSYDKYDFGLIFNANINVLCRVVATGCTNDKMYYPDGYHGEGEK